MLDKGNCHIPRHIRKKFEPLFAGPLLSLSRKKPLIHRSTLTIVNGNDNAAAVGNETMNT